MQGLYQTTFIPSTSQCDINGACKLSALLDAMQFTAHMHNKAAHVGRDDLSTKGLSWVLFKTEVEIERYPSIGETITIQTFTKVSRYKFFPRYYLVLDCAGNVLCKAGSLWMLMNNTSRNAVSAVASGIVIPEEEDHEIPIKISTLSKKVECHAISGQYSPLYTDIDINGHVNNVRYVDVLCNSLGMKIMREKEINFVSIDYNYEIPQDIIIQTNLMLKEEEFQFTGYSQEKQYFSIYGRFHSRDRMTQD